MENILKLFATAGYSLFRLRLFPMLISEVDAFPTSTANVAGFHQPFNQSEPFLLPKQANQRAGLCTQVFGLGCFIRMHQVKCELIMRAWILSDLWESQT